MGVARSGLWAPGMNHSIPSAYIGVKRPTSTGSVFFFFSVFLDGGFAQIFRQIIRIIVKTLRNTNLVLSRCFKMKKTSLPVDVRRSKTNFLKLRIYSIYVCSLFQWSDSNLCRREEMSLLSFFQALESLRREIDSWAKGWGKDEELRG